MMPLEEPADAIRAPRFFAYHQPSDRAERSQLDRVGGFLTSDGLAVASATTAAAGAAVVTTAGGTATTAGG